MMDVMELKRTRLYSTHEQLNAKMFEFAGWEMPLEYIGATKEHDYVRRSAGLFDVSHMGEIEVKGKDAFNFIQYLIIFQLQNVNGNILLHKKWKIIMYKYYTFMTIYLKNFLSGPS